jgi:hypothetical protein
VRAVVVALLLAGCSSLSSSKQYGHGSAAIGCATNDDCALAGAKCCECPTFAASKGDPAVTACAEVACPVEACPPNVQAACTAGMCELMCLPVACPTTCPDGYALDPTGCLECACSAANAQSCSRDSDCVRTRADCCGCANGGMDTAVPAFDQPTFDASLMCPAAPQCPNPDTCAPDLAPRCVRGQCELVPPTPPGACGRPDLPTCPAGQTCTLNTSDAATQQGVGVCM